MMAQLSESSRFKAPDNFKEIHLMSYVQFAAFDRLSEINLQHNQNSNRVELLWVTLVFAIL